MKKLAYLMVGALLLGGAAHAQKVKSKSVKTQYLKLPNINVSKTNPTDLSYSFASEEMTFSNKLMTDCKAFCVPRGAKSLKDVVELPAKYYRVQTQFPNAILIIKDKSGKMVYADYVAKGKKGYLDYGYQSCNNLTPGLLENNFKKDEANFYKKKREKNLNASYSKAKRIAISNGIPSYIQYELDVFGAKGGGFDYTEMMTVFEEVRALYKKMGKKGMDPNMSVTLNKAIKVWEKELKTSDVKNKKARINKKITRGLHKNLAVAYMFLYQTEKAIEHGQKAQELSRGFSTNTTRAWDKLVSDLRTYQIATSQNKELTTDLKKVKAKYDALSGIKLRVDNQGSQMYGALKSDLDRHNSEHQAARRKAAKEAEQAAIASGKLNPYQKYVTKTATQGNTLAIMAFPTKLSEFPKEVCDLDDLKEATIMGHEFSTVSSNIGKLNVLRKLSLYNNRINALPVEIGQMEALESLDLRKNSLTTIPAEIGNLSNLEVLKLSGNPITSIPAEIGNCKKLKKLYLKGSELSDDDKAKLKKLLPKTKIKF